MKKLIFRDRKSNIIFNESVRSKVRDIEEIEDVAADNNLKDRTRLRLERSSFFFYFL